MGSSCLDAASSGIILCLCLFANIFSLASGLEKLNAVHGTDTPNIDNEDSEILPVLISNEEKLYLREEAKEMFYHAYNSYMDNAYPADELMPLSCKGRWRDTEIPRGDIDETLGNFSLTLVDALDTLIVLGDLEEFENALKLIIKDVSFDRDVDVSLFETNIRMVGGLISGHVLADHMNQLYGAVSWYRGELLSMAQDLATRLLPAFNTSTGIPHPKVNLKYGMKSPKLQNSRDTCTACAGTIILEFASLSRLTGEPIFEEKARQAMDYLWSQRHRGSDLMGTVLNIHSGDWVRRDSGVGAGIDSYYEYLLKAYVLFGDESYLDRFNKHYNAVMKYVSQGPMLLDVHMHRPHTTSRNFMDALLAFWPGLQVLKGDIKPAIETHEMLFQVTQRHNFLPEAFTTDFQVHWGQHPLRPEFVESTYLLYQATADPYYLSVGKQILKSLQKHAWVPCGYAAVKDVRTGVLEDRMDSFVLSETFKYLYLLFAEPSELFISLDQFIFTTEAHLLPLSLARLSNLTAVPLADSMQDLHEDDDVEYARSCPNAHFLFPGRKKFAETIRKPLKNFVNNICPSRKTIKRKLRASEFQAGNAGHMSLLRDMGITIMALPDGRVQLLHTTANSKSPEDAEEGLLFMQEMIELSKLQQDQPDNPPRSVTFFNKPAKKENSSSNEKEVVDSPVTIIAGPAQFGLELKKDIVVTASIVKAMPLKACGKLENEAQLKDRIVIMERGDCMFIEKARQIESLQAVGGIVVDNAPGSSATTSPMFAMSGDGNDNVSIPLVFLFSADAQVLFEAMERDPDLKVALSDYTEADSSEDKFESAKITSTTPSEIVLEAAGPKVKSVLKKQQASTSKDLTCSDDLVISLLDENIAKDFEKQEKKSMSEAFKGIEDAETAEDVLQAALAFVGAHQKQSEASDSTLKQGTQSSVVAELQALLLKKTASNPSLLQSLLSVHLKELVNILYLAAESNKDTEMSLQLLITKLSSLGSTTPPAEASNLAPSSGASESIAGAVRDKLNTDFLSNLLKNRIAKLKHQLELRDEIELRDELEHRDDSLLSAKDASNFVEITEQGTNKESVEIVHSNHDKMSKSDTDYLYNKETDSHTQSLRTYFGDKDEL